MDLTMTTVWYSLALFCIIAVVTKIASGRFTLHPVCTRPPPPAVKGVTLIVLLHTFCTRGPEATMSYMYNKFGSVFRITFLWKRITFLVGPEVSDTFFQGLESEVTQGNITEFTVPMFGQEVGFGLDYATRTEQTRFFLEALRPSQLRNHVDPMIREVEVKSLVPYIIPSSFQKEISYLARTFTLLESLMDHLTANFVVLERCLFIYFAQPVSVSSSINYPVNIQ
jgi:sterol 14-demethylase